MFAFCSNLSSLFLNSFTTDKVTDMSSMFSFCCAMKSLDLSNFNTNNVKDMCWMFENCCNLTTLDLSGFTTNHVTDTERMFFCCSSLKSIFVRNEWRTSQLKYMDDMFAGCYSLVGGNGTVYNDEHINYEYARIDKVGKPGYFKRSGDNL